MEFEKIRKAIKPHLTPINIIAFSLFFFGVVALLLIILTRSNDSSTIAENQIQIKRGDKIVTINENGLVEYKSDKGTFYETWDENKTTSFFNSMRERARKYLENPTGPGEGKYEVTLWLDGELVVIYIDEDDEVIEEIFDEFGDLGGDGDLGQYFDEDDDDSQVFSTPTPTSIFASSPTPTLTPSPTSGSGSGGGGEQLQPDCDLYGEFITQRTVISNTLCQTEE